MTHQHSSKWSREQETPFQCLSYCYLLYLVLHFSKNFVVSWFNLKHLKDNSPSTKHIVGAYYMNVG